MVFLDELEVYENELTTLSPIENLPKLKRVTAYKNQLTAFPNFATPSQITYLHLGGNPLEHNSKLKRIH